MKYIAKIGAYDCAVGVEIFRRMHNYYNPDLVFFDWPGNKGGLWLEKRHYEEIVDDDSVKINKNEPYVSRGCKNLSRKLKTDQYWSC